MRYKNTLRLPASQEKYNTHIAEKDQDAPCGLCTKEIIHSGIHWKVIPNTFPYDRIASLHHMLVPNRHCTEDELTVEERLEFIEMKKGIIQTYEYILEGTMQTKSIPAHFHIHLINLKDFE